MGMKVIFRAIFGIDESQRGRKRASGPGFEEKET